MAYLQEIIYYGADQNAIIAQKMRDYLVSTGCCQLIDSATIQAGNSDHYFKIYPKQDSTTDIVFDILKTDGITVLSSKTIWYINNVTLTTKMVYSANGFGITFQGGNDIIDIIALKLLSPTNTEIWGICAETGSFGVAIYTNDTDIASTMTDANIAGTSAGSYNASATFLYKNQTLKEYTGKTRLVAGLDGVSAIANSGIASSSIMRLDQSYYMWVGTHNHAYVTDRSW